MRHSPGSRRHGTLTTQVRYCPALKAGPIPSCDGAPPGDRVGSFFCERSLGEVLSRVESLSVVGYGADLGHTLNVSRELRPDMVLLDSAVRDGPPAVRSFARDPRGVAGRRLRRQRIG